MTLDDILTNPIDLDQFLLSKNLDPLAPEHVADLQKIENLNVDGFNEAEVRSFIIDPIVRALGYQKGTIFSADLEHPLKFLDKNLYPDYQFTLWNENFWLIEAKRPRYGSTQFGYEDLSQAIEYSVHPKVNAALVALCDGLKLEVFDREVSVETPVLRVAIKSLVRDFDRIRAVLEPMQVWFFQKRRIVRLIDKVFDKEFNMNRVEEFSTLLERRLGGKRQRVVENFRQTIQNDTPEQLQLASTASVVELTELYLFMETLPIPIVNAVNLRLVALSEPGTWGVVPRIFPYYSRVVNDMYMGQALTYLMRLGERRTTIQGLPAWLARGNQANADLESATQFLLKQCLSYFEDHEPYRLILLAACTFARIAKFMAISNNAVRQAGDYLHALTRHQLPELSWSQIVASGAGHSSDARHAQTGQAHCGCDLLANRCQAFRRGGARRISRRHRWAKQSDRTR